MVSSLHRVLDNSEYSDSKTLYIEFQQPQVVLPTAKLQPIEARVFDECSKPEREDMTNEGIKFWNDAIEAATTISYVERRVEAAKSNQ